MFELNRTRGRWAFKDLLGQANHFLITILVGLNGVRANKVKIDAEFRTSWNPRDVEQSANRSRVFALDLALVRAIDALDTYMMMSARKPCALPSEDFMKKMDGTGRSVAKRLQVFNESLQPLPESHNAALEVAIEWRNRRVHSLADDPISKIQIEHLKSDSERFQSEYNGLNVTDLVSHFNMGISPTFKEATSIIRMCHEAVAHYDRQLLDAMCIEKYIRDSIYVLLREGSGDISKSCKQIWDHPKRETKSLRLLRLVGVSETQTITGREVSASFVTNFTNMTGANAIDFLSKHGEDIAKK